MQISGIGTSTYAQGPFGAGADIPRERGERLEAQTNIKSDTEQTLEKAVSPLTNLEAVTKDKKQAKATGFAEENSKPEDPNELTEAEEKQVQELKQRDAEVRAHEQAHAAVGGSYASSPSYEFTTGPDNKQYAVSGEVQIDSAPVPNDPEATIRKMDIVIRAALAPAEPSSQDIQVATKAQQDRSAAQSELAQQRLAEQKGESKDGEVRGVEENRETSGDPSEILAAILAYKASSS